MQKIEPERPSFASVLQNAVLTNFEDDKLIITLGVEGNIIGSHRYWLENQLSEFLQTSLRLEIKIKQEKQKAKKTEETAATKEEIMKKFNPDQKMFVN